MLLKFVVFGVVVLHAHSLRLDRPEDTDLDRPCRFRDFRCIRQELYERGYCPKHHQYPRDVLKMKRQVIPLPFFNYTLVMEDIIYEGLHRGLVTEFFLNKYTNNAVIMFEFRNITINSTATFNMHRQGLEDITIESPGTETYDSFSTSVMITGLTKHEHHTYDANTYFATLPSYQLMSKDKIAAVPEVSGTFARVNLQLGVAILDSFGYRSAIIAKFFAAILCSKK